MALARSDSLTAPATEAALPLEGKANTDVVIDVVQVVYALHIVGHLVEFCSQHDACRGAHPTGRTHSTRTNSVATTQTR